MASLPERRHRPRTALPSRIGDGHPKQVIDEPLVEPVVAGASAAPSTEVAPLQEQHLPTQVIDEPAEEPVVSEASAAPSTEVAPLQEHGTKTDSPKTDESRLSEVTNAELAYLGLVDLIVPSPADVHQAIRFQQQLHKTAAFEAIRMEGNAIDGFTIHVLLAESPPIAQLLQSMPMVKEVRPVERPSGKEGDPPMLQVLLNPEADGSQAVSGEGVDGKEGFTTNGSRRDPGSLAPQRPMASSEGTSSRRRKT